MQVDPEASHCGEVASESFPDRFPLTEARCATWPADLDWVPDRERPVVPEAMAALCRRCRGRSACLLWALTGQEQGYWAGTTTRDREQMRELQRGDVATADWLQEVARRRDGKPLHQLGEGSYWWYRRRGCRCPECKDANAAVRAHERAQARTRAAGAA